MSLKFNSQLFSQAGPIVGLFMLSAILSLLSPYFLTADNLINVVRQTAVNTLLATGMTLVILSGGIDLSVGSILALSSCTAALCLKAGWGTFAGIGVGIGIGGICGAANGILISYLRIPPFIATLGMMSIARGLALVLTQGYPVFGFSESFTFLGAGSLGGFLPMPILIMLSVVLVFHFILQYTRLGRYIYMIGGNEEAAALSGIPVRFHKFWIYTLCGGSAGLASLVFAARLNSAQPNAGIGYELDAIAAVVIGGTSLLGGEGNLWGTVMGAILMGVLRNGLNLLNVSSFWQLVVIGWVIILAVYLDRLRHKQS
ncbi:MAG: ABC transporter permease [Elusimicrobia bacterium]|nr:ABC transporter permease [Elusimicrobiota bacterium]